MDEKKNKNFETIKDLVDIMDDASLTALRYDDGEIRLELERCHTQGQAVGQLSPEQLQQLVGTQQGKASPAPRDVDENTIMVRSPTVGVFYASPSPDEEPFVRPGQEVLAGQTLAIVEAMKVMNEIHATAPGTVMEVLVDNGMQVEYDQALFSISPAPVV